MAGALAVMVGPVHKAEVTSQRMVVVVGLHPVDEVVA